MRPTTKIKIANPTGKSKSVGLQLFGNQNFCIIKGSPIIDNNVVLVIKMFLLVYNMIFNIILQEVDNGSEDCHSSSGTVCTIATAALIQSTVSSKLNRALRDMCVTLSALFWILLRTEDQIQNHNYQITGE